MRGNESSYPPSKVSEVCLIKYQTTAAPPPAEPRRGEERRGEHVTPDQPLQLLWNAAPTDRMESNAITETELQDTEHNTRRTAQLSIACLT